MEVFDTAHLIIQDFGLEQASNFKLVIQNNKPQHSQENSIFQAFQAVSSHLVLHHARCIRTGGHKEHLQVLRKAFSRISCSTNGSEPLGNAVFLSQISSARFYHQTKPSQSLPSQASAWLTWGAIFCRRWIKPFLVMVPSPAVSQLLKASRTRSDKRTMAFSSQNPVQHQVLFKSGSWIPP